MPRIESSIEIDAPRDTVIEIARDNARFPDFMSDLKSLDVLEKSDDGLRVVSDWVGIVPKFNKTIHWVEEDVWDLDAGTCTFRQLRGDYQQFEGVWTFSATSDTTTRFDSVLDYELEIPLVGALIKNIIKKTVQDNLDGTLRAIKERCEAR